MAIVIADTGPINYLILIAEIALLPKLFESVLIPDVVAGELRHPHAPSAVRDWMDRPPAWLTIVSAPAVPDTFHPVIDRGEQGAIVLAEFLAADLLLMDDRAAVAAASARGLQTVGTLGLLVMAARRGLVDLPTAVARLNATNFRVRPALLVELIDRYHAASGSVPEADR
jgi:predicted nucleic acid-binding protein